MICFSYQPIPHSGGNILSAILTRLPLVLLIWIFLCTPCVSAELPVSAIVNDLRAIEAAVIVRPNGRLLLNKGSNDSVHKGDLWSIYNKRLPFYSISIIMIIVIV